jgi:hypothetical protein
MVAHGHGDHPAATPSVLNLQRRSLRKLTARRALPAKYASPFVPPGAMGMALEGGEVKCRERKDNGRTPASCRTSRGSIDDVPSHGLAA